VTARALPRSLEELRGRRAARWLRESTRGQLDNFGPDAQRRQQDEAIERWGLVDVGIAWEVAHSGRTVATTGQWAEMVAGAGDRYDVLVVGYVSRFARDLRTAVNARHDLHARGAAILFADERVLSSDESEWERWAREAVEAEAYSRRLGRSIGQGLAAKWRRYADQAGNPPIGFRRSLTPPHLMEVDPATIGAAVAVFRRYAEGSLPIRELAEATGLGYEQVAKMVRNPIYNGWARRHRGAAEERVPAPWRTDPPVDDELWRRVEDLRSGRRHGGGRPGPGADLLRGLVVCAACGVRIRSNGTMGQGRRQRLHPDPCPDWPGPASVRGAHFDERITGQLAGARLTRETEERVRAVVGSMTTAPADTTRARLQRRLRELALEHADGRLPDGEYLAASTRLRSELEAAGAPRRAGVTPDEAVDAIRDLAALLADATDEERARIAHAVYARIPIAGAEIRPVELTPWAYELGLDQVLPEIVRLDWRPRQETGTQGHTARVPIAGRRERLAAARRLRSA
jgi:DNA invertase Pin-like site-specific DNA recombinase